MPATSSEKANALLGVKSMAKGVAGATASLAAAGTAQANIVGASNLPLSLSTDVGSNFSVGWDVDNSGGADFGLRLNYFSYPGGIMGTVTAPTSMPQTQTAFTARYGTVYLLSDQGGRGMVGTGYTNIHNLPLGFIVGPTLAAYNWNASEKTNVAALKYSLYVTSQQQVYTTEGGVTTTVGQTEVIPQRNSVLVGSNLTASTPRWDQTSYTTRGAPGGISSGKWGFRFDIGGNTHYGWATVEVDTTGANRLVTITEAYYQDTPDTGIAVGAIPEPSQVALLALGSAGLAAMRRRKKAA